MSWRSKPRPTYIGDNTMSAVNWAKGSIMERALAVARSQERNGVREITANWSPAIRLYLRVCGIFVPAAWCAAFVAWCLLEAGADRKKLTKYLASTYFWWKWAVDNKRTVTHPTRGCLFVWNNANGGHIGFVLQTLKNGRFATLEGNTDDRGSREGVKVADRIRSMADLRKNKRWALITIPDWLGESA